MSNQSHEHLQGFLRLPEVLRILPISKSAWWAGVKSGRYPKPVKLGVRTTAWIRSDIQSLVQALSAKNGGQHDSR